MQFRKNADRLSAIMEVVFNTEPKTRNLKLFLARSLQQIFLFVGKGIVSFAVDLIQDLVQTLFGHVRSFFIWSCAGFIK